MSGKKETDPTDAPFIPSMGGGMDDSEEEEEALALGGDPALDPPDPPRIKEDPVVFAERLADQAKRQIAEREEGGVFPEDGDADAWEDVSEEEARAAADAILARATARKAEREAQEAEQATAKEQAPTDAPAPPRVEDPRALAKRLAEQAKQKAQAQEDPRALAKRLAEQAKQKAQAQEDPRALAKRLAEQAKKKAQAQEDPRALAKRLAEQAKRKAGQAPASQKAQPTDMMSRMGRPTSKRRSAAEILAEARATEQAREKAAARQKESAAQLKAQAEQAHQAAEQAQEALADAAPTSPLPAATSEEVDPEQAIRQALGGTPTIIEVKRPASSQVLEAVWSAHLARAQASHDLDLAVAASAILGALKRVGAEGLAAAEVRAGGVEHAIFVEVGTGALIAAATPPHVYLAGC